MRGGLILCAAVPETVVPEPSILHGVLPPPLFSAFQLYVRELARTEALSWEEWGRRHVRHNDPIAVLLHEKLVEQVEQVVGRKVKPSYVFLACYADGGRVPPHRDRAQCQYTLDLCVAHDGPAWPLHVEGTPYVIAANDALVYRGCELTHHRDVKPAATLAHLAFFHFVDASFEGPLD
jgi:hypothetical protein